MAKKEKVTPMIESPTWGDLRNLATKVMELLDGNVGAAQKLNERNFYTLAILTSLNEDAALDLPIFGEKRITLK
jgi:hypothetical protein